MIVEKYFMVIHCLYSLCYGFTGMTDRPPIDTLHPHDRNTLFSRSTDHEDPLGILVQQDGRPIPLGGTLDGTIRQEQGGHLWYYPLDLFWI